MENKGPPPRKVSIITVGGTVGGERDRSCYRVLAEGERANDGHCVWIEDLDGYKSVTNDAERVTQELAASFGGRVRIIYKDTSGLWDELMHVNGKFETYAPARHLGLCE